MLKLVFFVPDEFLEAVKQAVFAAGAGQQGNYGSCCWQVRGVGQFCPLEGTDPFLGEVGALEQVDEWRVETLCPESSVKAVVAALKQAHPYEEVAFDLTRLVNVELF